MRKLLLAYSLIPVVFLIACTQAERVEVCTKIQAKHTEFSGGSSFRYFLLDNGVDLEVKPSKYAAKNEGDIYCYFQ